MAPFIYPTNIPLNTEAVIRGMNVLWVAQTAAGAETVVHSILIVGQHSELPISENTTEGPDALRVLIIYRHTPSNTLGVLSEDISYTFLRELAALGTKPGP